MQKNIFIVDDHPLFRAGLKSVINNEPNFRVIGESNSGSEALNLMGKLEIEIVLLDLSLPDINGLKLAEKIKVKYPECLIMIISMHTQEEYILKAIEIGANGYIAKNNASQKTLNGLNTIVSGKYFFGPWYTSSEVERIYNDSSNKIKSQVFGFTDLTSREQEIFCLLSEDYSLKEIGSLLFISPKTVDNHRTNIMKKLKLHSKIQLVRYAAQIGVVEHTI